MDNIIDISNKPSPHSLRNKLFRVVWGLVYFILFRPSPNPFRIWRVFLLKCMGANISFKARIAPSAKILFPWNLSMDDYATLGPHSICYCTAPIYIGAMATVSQYAYLCSATHDYEHKNFILYALPISIKPNAWVCADSMVGPGVTIGEGAVLGAKSSTFKDLEDWKVYAGTPAKYIKDRVIKRGVNNE